MKITSNNKSNKKILLLAGVLLSVFLSGLIAIYIISEHNRSTNPWNQSNDTPKAVADNDQKGLVPSSTLPNNSQSLTTEEVPTNKEAVAVIRRLEQKDTTIYLDATISNVAKQGKCVIIFSTPNDKPVTKEFDSTKNGDIYTCSLATSALEFSYLGKWDVTLRYYSENSQVVAKGALTIS